MNAETACRRLVEEFGSRPTLRAGSLITTVFGDAILPRGGSVWLGSLIAVMNDFGIGERLVRTSVFRLAKDGWLQAEQVGRRSYYSLTAEGRERFDQATERIYGTPVSDWDGRWTLLLLSGLDTEGKEAVRKEFGWLGFAAMSANVLAHPSPAIGDIDVTSDRLGVARDLVVLTGQTVRNAQGMQRLVHDCWNLDEIGERYAQFTKMFRPIMRSLQKNPKMSDKTAFLARTLLIQEYRKALLRDPLLPDDLRPADWQGKAAYQLCRNLYVVLHPAADHYVGEAMETAEGPLPPLSVVFSRRFGGLNPEQQEQVING